MLYRTPANHDYERVKYHSTHILPHSQTSSAHECATAAGLTPARRMSQDSNPIQP